MKVSGIVCSPRRYGNTEILVQEALSAARENGTEVTGLLGGRTGPVRWGCGTAGR